MACKCCFESNSTTVNAAAQPSICNADLGSVVVTSNGDIYIRTTATAGCPDSDFELLGTGGGGGACNCDASSLPSNALSEEADGFYVQDSIRPFWTIGGGTTRNSDSVNNTADIYHIGNTVIGAASLGNTNAVFGVNGNSGFGAHNHDLSNSTNSTAFGNNISINDSENALGTGVTNNIISADSTFISGEGNTITTGGHRSTIIGGQGNVIQANVNDASIIGGQSNSVNGDFSVIIGSQTSQVTGNTNVIIGSNTINYGGAGASESVILNSTNINTTGADNTTFINSDNVDSNGQYTTVISSFDSGSVAQAGINVQNVFIANSINSTSDARFTSIINSENSTITNGQVNGNPGGNTFMALHNTIDANIDDSSFMNMMVNTENSDITGALDHNMIVNGRNAQITATNASANTIIGEADIIGTNAFQNNTFGYNIDINSSNFNTILGDRVNVTHDSNFAYNNTGAVLNTVINQGVTFAASGGYRMFTNAAFTTGAALPTGASAWIAVSSRNHKKEIKKQNANELAEKLTQLELYSYKYDTDGANAELGFIAEEWNEILKDYIDPKLVGDIPGISMMDGIAAAFALAKAAYNKKSDFDELEEFENRLNDIEKWISNFDKNLESTLEKIEGTHKAAIKKIEQRLKRLENE